MKHAKFHYTRYKDINDTTHVVVVAPVDAHLAQTKKGQFHLKLHPRRRNVAAQVAEELKTVTYATPPMEERRKKERKPWRIKPRISTSWLGLSSDVIDQPILPTCPLPIGQCPQSAASGRC